MGLWNKISRFGLSDTGKTTDYRHIVLTNQLNIVLCTIFGVLIIATAIIRRANHGEYTIHTQKMLVVFVLGLVNILLMYYRKIALVKFNLIFLLVAIGVIWPITVGAVQEIDFVFAPLIILASSFIPQLILRPAMRNTMYLASIIYFLLLIVSIDEFMVYFSSTPLMLPGNTNNFHLYYSLVLTSVFLFIHLALYYMGRLNCKYETEMLGYNEELNATIEELKLTQQHLVQSEKMASLGTLTAGIAHEINNPLNYINSGLSILNDLKLEMSETVKGDIAERCDVSIDIMREGLNKTKDIVQSLITFSYKGTKEKEKSDVCEIIDSSLLFLQSKIKPDIQVEKQYRHCAGVMLFPNTMHQVFLNILDNAVFALNESAQAEKKIVITTNSNQSSLSIIIYNNGPAIPDSVINQIFDPFYTNKKPGVGTGLGLSICYRIISVHNGRIIAKNEKPGVSFILELPTG